MGHLARLFCLIALLHLLYNIATTEANNSTFEHPFRCDNNTDDDDYADDPEVICWPKCCYANQAFNAVLNSCQEVNSSLILDAPEISYLRYLNQMMTSPNINFTTYLTMMDQSKKPQPDL